MSAFEVFAMLLKLQEVADRLRVNRDRVGRLIRSGHLAASDIAVGNRAEYRISEAALTEFLASTQVVGCEPESKPTRRRRRRRIKQ